MCLALYEYILRLFLYHLSVFDPNSFPQLNLSRKPPTSTFATRSRVAKVDVGDLVYT
jgi:hypothetical protein